MTRVRALAVLAAALAAVPIASLGGGSAALADTCTTALRGGADRPLDAPFDVCAAAVLIVTPNPALPGAVVRLDGSGSEGDDVGGGIATYVWDFGDGDGVATTAPDSFVEHVYARGRYTVGLRVENADGDQLGEDMVELVVSELPVARLAVPGGVLRPGVEYAFDATGSSAPGGSIDHYSWNFGDGTSMETATPVVQHTFARDGASSAVSVRVVNDLELASAPATAAVTVANQLPLVQLIATPATVGVGEFLTLDATGSSDPDGAIVRYDWDLDGNGSFETTTGLTPTVRAGGWPNPGIIVPRVRVVDDSGAGSVKGIAVTVQGAGGGLGPGGGDGAGSGAGSGRSGGGPGAGGAGAGGGVPTGPSFAVTLGGAAIQRLQATLRRGVALTAAANRAARGRLTLTVRAADARALGLRARGRRAVAIGTLRLALRAGRVAKPKVRLKRAAARALRRTAPASLRVTIRGTLAAGPVTAAVVRVVLLRG